MSTKFRLLVADDDSGIRDLVRTYLDAANYEVHVVRDGSEVGSRLVQLAPHALILDINMPKMDGFAVLESLRPTLQARNIPVLVLTARHAADDVRRAVSLGAKDYLTKPFQKEQLIARVGRLLRCANTQPAPTKTESAEQTPRDHVA